MSTMAHPESVPPAVLERIANCNVCEARRRPRMCVCTYHEGWWDGWEAADAQYAGFPEDTDGRTLEDFHTSNTPHGLCPELADCSCRSEMGNRLLRELLDALGIDHPASPEPPRLVWERALATVRQAMNNTSYPSDGAP